MTERASTRLRVRITLACGHVIRTRNRPFSFRVRFSCWAGTGCGHAVPWKELEDTQAGTRDVNYRMPEWKHPAETEEKKHE